MYGSDSGTEDCTGCDRIERSESGKGAKILREAGVRVEEDFLREECDALNPVFFHYITTGLPYVVMKYAMTADGKIATKTGASKWISGEEARSLVHEMRHDYMAIMESERFWQMIRC